jgi:hypothetical protein
MLEIRPKYSPSADTDTRGDLPPKGGDRVIAKMLQVAIADEHVLKENCLAVFSAQ